MSFEETSNMIILFLISDGCSRSYYDDIKLKLSRFDNENIEVQVTISLVSYSIECDGDPETCEEILKRLDLGMGPLFNYE